MTRFYDPLVRLMLRDRRLKTILIRQAAIQPGWSVLDLGCGTGTLALMLKESQPEATVVGLDGDRAVLVRARAKAASAGLDVAFHEGLASSPPFAPESFDCVLSSLLLHHLSSDDKRQTLVAARHLLRPGQKLHVADWSRPQNLLTGVGFLLVRVLDGFGNTADNAHGRIQQLIEEAGFVGVEETERAVTTFGTLSFWHGIAPTVENPCLDGARCET